MSAAWAGETAVISVEETTLKLVAATAPKATLVAPEKPVPVTVTVVPPVVGPELGEIDVMVGVAVAPMTTLARPVKPASVMATVVPPAVAPEAERMDVAFAGDAVDVEVNTLPPASTAAQKLVLGHDTEKSWLLPSMSEGADHEDPL
jgi:hypothetical protein